MVNEEFTRMTLYYQPRFVIRQDRTHSVKLLDVKGTSLSSQGSKRYLGEERYKQCDMKVMMNEGRRPRMMWHIGEESNMPYG